MTVTTMPARRVATQIDSVLGRLTLTADDATLTGVYFERHRYPPRAHHVARWVLVSGHHVLQQAADELTAYLAGGVDAFSVPIATAGNPLQERVWARLRQIPRGRTTTYGTIAVELGGCALAQAVGQAVAHNPLSIVVPCHRVLGANGSLTGFAGGLDRKRFLLDLEAPGEPRLL